MTTKAHKLRLYSKREPRLPVPKIKKAMKGSFALRTLNNADHRFAIVKELHRRLNRLLDEAGVETLQREWLAARAVFLSARIESLEYDSATGKQIDWADYRANTKVLAEVLKTLGLHKEARTTKRLRQYVIEHTAKNGKVAN